MNDSLEPIDWAETDLYRFFQMMKLKNQKSLSFLVYIHFTKV